MKNFNPKLFYLLFPILGFCVFYLPASFVLLTFDISKWDSDTRLLVAMEGMISAIAGGLIAYQFNNKK